MKEKELIDSRNVDLWSYLKAVHNINVDFGSYDSYGVFSKGNDSTIYVPQDRLSASAFTHELLHILLRTKDIFIGSSLLRFRQNPNLCAILSEKLLEHIGNCLSHVKMFPIFVAMGFDKKEFISDYNVNKLSKEDVSVLQKNFHRKSLFGGVYIDGACVDFYIGKYFSAKSCPNSSFDYSENLYALKCLNPELFSILDGCMNEWINLDIDDTDPITGSYLSITYPFENALEDWVLSNKIK
jgi:hypothetical protein